MGKLAVILFFILSVFPPMPMRTEGISIVVRRGSKKSHRGETVAKIWIEESGQIKEDIICANIKTRHLESRKLISV